MPYRRDARKGSDNRKEKRNSSPDKRKGERGRAKEDWVKEKGEGGKEGGEKSGSGERKSFRPGKGNKNWGKGKEEWRKDKGEGVKEKIGGESSGTGERKTFRPDKGKKDWSKGKGERGRGREKKDWGKGKEEWGKDKGEVAKEKIGGESSGTGERKTFRPDKGKKDWSKGKGERGRGREKKDWGKGKKEWVKEKGERGREGSEGSGSGERKKGDGWTRKEGRERFKRSVFRPEKDKKEWVKEKGERGKEGSEKEWGKDKGEKGKEGNERRTFRPDREKKDWGRGKGERGRVWTKGKKEREKDSSLDSRSDEPHRLNRYIANAGICSRREADELIASGQIEVNGVVVTELGTKVNRGDKVRFKGKHLAAEKTVYLLLNKPKDYLTTMSDTHGRKTVMELIRNAGRERVVPVGRLDKNTTGLLLFTNDGDLTRKLTHPSHLVRKLYHVTVNRNISPEDVRKLAEGFELEDGFIKVDEVSYVEKAGKNEIGILLHSGRNRIVRRMLEHLGYRVVRLDRVAFANLTKKDLPRGRWRRLSPREVSTLMRIAGSG